MQPIWYSFNSVSPDQTVHLRARFSVDAQRAAEFRHLAVGCYLVWLDGEFLCDGPARFHPDHPEYLTKEIECPSGEHRLDVLCSFFGVETRLLHTMRPFFAGELLDSGGEIPLHWKARRLDQPIQGADPLLLEEPRPNPGRLSQIRRINGQLGWMEYHDGRNEHPILAEEDAPEMKDAVPVGFDLSRLRAAGIADVRHLSHTAKPSAQGQAEELFGYEWDDPPTRFFLRNLAAPGDNAEGVWRRYDLGRVSLARPRFVIDAPAGTVVEFAASERLIHGRVSPYINLSIGQSCNMSRFVAGGGPQEYFPISPLGGRFWEVHAMGDAKQIRFVREEFLERAQYGEPAGSFACNDGLLNRIWEVGVATLRSCSEDALTDNPTRERGQWTGDVTGAGSEIASVAYADLRIMRRAYVQAAQSAREDGLIAGMHPGEECYLATYSLHWYEGVLRYFELTGDDSILRELRAPAERNMALFQANCDSEGLHDIGIVFIDWGYVRNAGPVSLAFNMWYLSALRQWRRWRVLLGEEIPARDDAHAQEIERICCRLLQAEMNQVLEFAEGFRFHDAVIALRLGLIEEPLRPRALRAIEAHILDCFPNNPQAPRLSSPTVASTRLITPYFMHYCLPLFIEAGEMDFVLDQFRSCWSWPLAEGLTTWPEVFDLRWSHCHAWAGCPTWQLSRYVLGLQTRFDLGERTFAFHFEAGSLEWAEGSLPLPDGRKVRVNWKADGPICRWRVSAPAPIRIQFPANVREGAFFEGRELELELPLISGALASN